MERRALRTSVVPHAFLVDGVVDRVCGDLQDQLVPPVPQQVVLPEPTARRFDPALQRRRRFLSLERRARKPSAVAAGQKLGNGLVASRMLNREQVIRQRTMTGLVRPLYPCARPALLEKVAHVTTTSSTLWSRAMAEQESFGASGSSPPRNASHAVPGSPPTP